MKEFEEVRHLLDMLDSRIYELRRRIEEYIVIASERGVDKNRFIEFLLKPWYIERREDYYLVIVPKFIDFTLGWLVSETDTYNVFRVDIYTSLLYPETIEKLDIPIQRMKPSYKAVVEDGLIKIEGDEKKFRRDFRQYISRKVGDGIYKVKRGREFELIASLVRKGILPFKPRKVDENDIYNPPRLSETIRLNSLQKTALKKFMEYGAIGIYSPPASGKSMLALYIMSMIKGRKLVIVPTRTLAEMWRNRVETYIPDVADEVEIATYYNRAILNNEYVLTVFDEVHHLPADTFIRLSTIKTKYRVGTSATPYREDGRTDLIIALTGYPVGIDWRSYFREYNVVKPRIKVLIVNSIDEKIQLIPSLIKGRTIVFSDSIELGKRVAELLGIEHIHGKTRDRMKKIRGNRVVVVSRVGDEGLSIDDVDTVIEIDFHHGSRRQALQRLGRLLHSMSGRKQYYLLMTRGEYRRYRKRLLAYEEKGFNYELTTT